MRKKKKITVLKKEIKQVKSENDRLYQCMKEFAEQIEQAERILHEVWTDAGEEDERLEKAGRTLYMAYMPVKSPIDEFWRLSPTPYDHVDPLVSTILKRSFKYSPDNSKRTKKIAYPSKSHTGWETAKNMSLEDLACRLREDPTWDLGIMREICRRAHMLPEWQKADCLSFERVADMAAKKLGVDIGIPDGLYQGRKKINTAYHVCGVGI